MNKDALLAKVGHAIRVERKKNNYSQEKLGELAGLDRSYIGGVERGERNLSMKILFKIAKALETKPAQFVDPVEVEDL